MPRSLSDIAEHIGAKIVYPDNESGDSVEGANCEISALATLVGAQKGQIAFLANKKYRQQLEDTHASAVIIAPESIDACKTIALVMDNPYMGYAMTAQLLDNTPASADNVHPSAVIDSSAVLGNNVCIGANAVIESGVNLADEVSIGAGCFVGKNAQIGKATTLWANTTVYHNVIIGEYCLIQANTVIGSDGFGYAPVNNGKNGQNKWLKIPQLGSVIIGDHVEIGASTTIDRGALEDTIIKSGVIIDNQVQIAHNVVLGENTAMAACSVVAGSTIVGKNCTMAGLVGVNGHINITDDCIFTGMAMVTKDVKTSGVYSSGLPAVENRVWRKTNARINRLESMAQRLKTLENNQLK